MHPCHIYSDGVPEIPVNKEVAKRLTLQEAHLARAQNIEIFAIGIGEQITQEVIHGIANQPPSRHVFRVDQFRELEFILKPVARAACVAPGKDLKQLHHLFQQMNEVYGDRSGKGFSCFSYDLFVNSIMLVIQLCLDYCKSSVRFILIPVIKLDCLKIVTILFIFLT